MRKNEEVEWLDCRHAQCNEKNPPSAAYCRRCGRSLPSTTSTKVQLSLARKQRVSEEAAIWTLVISVLVVIVVVLIITALIMQGLKS